MQLYYLTLLFTSYTQAVTTRTANAVIKNESSNDLKGVVLLHKYSDVFKNDKTFDELAAGQTSDSLTVEYNTGFGTTGVDWWTVGWTQVKENEGSLETKACYFNPLNFRNIIDSMEQVFPKIISQVVKVGVTAATKSSIAGKVSKELTDEFLGTIFNEESTEGFKRHFLESEDEGQTVTLTIKDDGKATIQSPSGESETVYDCKTEIIPITN